MDFLSRTDVSDIMRELSNGDPLTIYCGAGVTIDKTNMGWSQVISAAYGSKEEDWRYYPTERESHVLKTSADPMQLATIYQRYLLDHFGDEQKLLDHVAANLRNRFYGANEWLSGGLARNVAFLALVKAAAGVNVNIVTTNYETHTEDAIKERLSKFEPFLRKRGRGIKVVRKYLRKATNGRKAGFYIAQSRTEKVGVGNFAVITLTYLHGCLTSSGLEDRSALVISEEDYTTYRDVVESRLEDILRKKGTVLFVGTSMSDPPLVSTLIRTRRRDEQNRIALLPLETSLYDTCDERTTIRVVDHWRVRGNALGTIFLIPDFKFEVSQFIEEVTHYAMQSLDGRSADTALPNGERLLEWWQTWERNRGTYHNEEVHDALRESVRAIVKSIRSEYPSCEWDLESKEHFKLELWVRDSPERHRHLTKWAASNAILTDREALSKRDIEIGSRIAAVYTYAEGRPQHLDSLNLTRDCADASTTGRWKSYYSVPIFLHTYSDNDISKTVSAGDFHVRTLVGVVTLASTKSRSSSVLPLQASIMQRIKNEMIDCGRRILDPRRLPTCTTDDRHDNEAM